jgi:hypothetical protein
VRARAGACLFGVIAALAAGAASAQRGGMGSGNPGHAAGSIFGSGGGGGGGGGDWGFFDWIVAGGLWLLSAGIAFAVVFYTGAAFWYLLFGDSRKESLAARAKSIGIGFLPMLLPIPLWLLLYLYLDWGFIGSTLAVAAITLAGAFAWVKLSPSDGRVVRPKYVGKNHGPF